MISVFFDKNNQDSSRAAEVVKTQISGFNFIKLQDYSDRISFASFSILIITDPILDLHIWGNYGLITLSDSSHHPLPYPYPAKFTLNIEALISSPDHLPSLLKQFLPKIPNYKQSIIHESPSIHPIPNPATSFHLQSNIPLIQQPDYEVRSLQFHTNEPYSISSNLSLFPENSEKLVNSLCELQNYQDWVLSIPGSQNFDQPNFLRFYLKTKCDLTGLIRKPALKMLGQYCQDQEMTDLIGVLTTLKGKEKFVKIVEERCLSLVDLLREFRIVIPPNDLLQIVDTVKPRLYSITSAYPENLEIAVQILVRGDHVGCFSQFALDHQQGVFVKGEMKKSVFELAFDRTLLLIANGCGIAPFRAVLKEVNKSPERFPKVLIVAGFRTPDHFIYKSDFESLINENPSITSLICYSRSGPKQHIQSLITSNSSLISSYLQGQIFICGGSEMGKSIISQLESLSQSISVPFDSIKPNIKLETWG